MFNLKSKNFGKKLAAILLAATAVIVPVISLCFANNSYAETNQWDVGAKVAYKKVDEVVKDTICVKRWHLYTFTLYYLGTYEHVYMGEIQDPIYVNNKATVNFGQMEQNIVSYSVSETVSNTSKESLKVISSEKVGEFLGKVELSVTEEKYYSLTQSVSQSKTEQISKSVSIYADGSVDAPINCYYVHWLMLSRANKFKLVVTEKQQAKTRKSALHNWSGYKTEIEEVKSEYFFYSSYLPNGESYYQKIGSVSDTTEIEILKQNIGK